MGDAAEVFFVVLGLLRSPMSDSVAQPSMCLEEDRDSR